MDFHQLYYTSCRTGLSGYAGYQFNAVTPGVPAEVMGEVEALGSYEPPATLGHSPTPEQVARCPVNLCFVPGPRPIVANVTFTGTDYSGRFGNYFAHALVPVRDGAWEGPAPIELWRAPLWAREPVADTALPPVRGPLPLGPLRRDVIDDFLDGAPGRSMLPALLAAVERAVLDRDRSVVILAADADEVARWIAAVSFLLPPGLVARMSFATYRFRPSYSRHHVIGALPGAEIAADERSFQAFYLFDFTAGAASEIQAGPLPHLLAAAGTVAAGSLWRQASALGGGGETRLEDWYAPAVAAALLGRGVGLGPADLDAVCAWLGEHAARLGEDTIGRIGAALLEHDAASPAHLAGLADGAAAGGSGELLALVEERLVTAQLGRLSGVPAPATGAHAGAPPGAAADAIRPLRSPRAREHARRRYAHLLAGADAGTVVRLLGTAAAHDVSPDAETLRECGLRAVGPELLRPPPPAGVYEAVRRWPDLRAGALACLARSAAAGESLRGVFEGGLGAAVPDAELAALPALREAALIARALGHPERRVDTALALLSGRTPAEGLDDDLLDALWPDGWSLDDACALLARLPREALGGRALADRVAPLLERPSPDGDRSQAEAYGALCDLLGSLPPADALPDGPREVLEAMTRVRQAERRLTGAGDGRERPTAADRRERLTAGEERERPTARDGRERLATGEEGERLTAGESLAAVYDRTRVPAIKSYLRLRLPALLASLPHETLAALLARVPGRVRDLYLAEVERELGGERAVDVAVAAFVMFCAARRHERTRQVAEDVQDVLLRTLPNWRRRDLNEVEQEVRRGSNRMGDEFKRWRAQVRPRRGWLPGRLFQG